MPDQHAFVAVAAVAHHFHVHFGHQRAGRVENLQAAPLGFLADRLGNAVGAEDDDDVVRHLIEFLDEDGAALAQVVHDELVVHHLVTHVDRRTEDIEGTVDDLDGAIHAGAEAAGIGEFDLHGGLVGDAVIGRMNLATALPAWEGRSDRRFRPAGRR